MTERSHDDMAEFDIPRDALDADGRGHDVAHDPADDPPLEPWMLTLAREVDEDVAVPREMMWQRIQQRRAAATVPDPVFVPTDVPSVQRRGWWPRLAAVAAVLVGGIAIGRYSATGAGPTGRPTVAAVTLPSASPSTSPGPLEVSAAPARVAMQEHLLRTVALLTTVRDRDPALGPAPDLSSWARDLLGTTRLLLDEPSLRDDRTRRLLQDLELVLMQILQSRGTEAPEAQRAPTETMRETNLLPRVRAVVTASAHRQEQTVHGDDE